MNTTNAQKCKMGQNGLESNTLEFAVAEKFYDKKTIWN